jgi:hypothetical protein
MAKDSLRERLREPVYARAYREYLTSLVRRAQQQKPSAVLRGGQPADAGRSSLARAVAQPKERSPRLALGPSPLAYP